MAKEQSTARSEDREEKGDYPLRIPKWMLQEAARIAGKRGLSLNAWLSNLIGQAIEDNPPNPAAVGPPNRK